VLIIALETGSKSSPPLAAVPTTVAVPPQPLFTMVLSSAGLGSYNYMGSKIVFYPCDRVMGTETVKKQKQRESCLQSDVI